MAEQRIQTARFGEISIDTERVIRFIEPVLGFPHSQEYTLLDHAKDSPFKWLQSLQEPELAFVVTNPQFFGIPYEFSLSDDYVNKLALGTVADTLILTIVNIPQGNPTQMTSNLLGPIVINQDNRQAIQVILSNASFSTKTRLLPDSPSIAEPQTSGPASKRGSH